MSQTGQAFIGPAGGGEGEGGEASQENVKHTLPAILQKKEDKKGKKKGDMPDMLKNMHVFNMPVCVRACVRACVCARA